MTKVIGVRFRNSGKVYYFDPQDLPLRNGLQVIVETSRGMECGRVVLSPREVADEKVNKPLRPVLRIATEEDLERERTNRQKEKEAYRICQQKIAEHGLEMKLIQCEFTFDNKKVLFYFTADGRVDFRELVKDLASVFRTRIELRQIGVRDETKLLGGIGICGRPLCCSTFLSDFSSVSIRMAKEQNLSLNPTKISGTCGRLMCCLKNEQETYEFLNKRLPGVGDIVRITGDEDAGDWPAEEVTGEVQTVNVLRQTARVLVVKDDDKEIAEYPAGQLEVVMTRRKKNKERAKERERERERAKALAEAEKAGRAERPERNRRREKRAGNEPEAEEEVRSAEASERSERPRRRGSGDMPEEGRRTETAGHSERSRRRRNDDRKDSARRRENDEKPEDIRRTAEAGQPEDAGDGNAPAGEKRRRRRHRRRSNRGEAGDGQDAAGSEARQDRAGAAKEPEA